MSSSAASVANAAVAYSTFNSFRLGRAARTVVTLLICLWDSRNINKNGEFMGITILLLDELYRPSLKACSILRLDRFEVARVAHMYKITEHQFLIVFIPSP
uniref:DUF223 domain-containing protein n=1 Tax=Brassica oleracea var. oleracea TaxID=109376 RepID=A0A0D2ZVH3_BRAOL